MNNKISLLSMSVAVAVAAFSVTAAESTSPNDFEKVFIEDASFKMHSFLYIRDREEKRPGEDFKPQIENQTLQLGADYRSGYLNDVVGIDFWGSTNLKLGDTVGQSEILEYDYDCNDDGVQGDACEKTNTSINIAALKFKFGDKDLGVNARAGYTRINIGTIRSSWGLNPHSYRGIETVVNVGNFKFGYAWADEFKNDWSSEFKEMTNAWHQGGMDDLVKDDGTARTPAEKIDFIHTLGASYKFDGGTLVDFGFGEGADYRKNWQALVKHTIDLGDGKLEARGFYHGGEYIEGKVSKVTDSSKESYIGLGVTYKSGGLKLTGGYSVTDAPDTSAYNFRVTPWANSDNRNYMQATSQLEDYNADGTQAVKVRADYNFQSLPELSVGLGANYGWNMVSDASKKGSERDYDGSAYSLDMAVTYKFLDGGLKGMKVMFNPAVFRSEDTTYKYDRNDMKLMFAWSTEDLLK